MTAGEIFDKIREYFRGFFRMFMLFHAKQAEEHHKEQKESEVSLKIDDQKGAIEKYEVNKIEQVEKLNKELKEQRRIEEQKLAEDENRLQQQKELSVELEKQNKLEETRLEAEGEPIEGKAILQESATPEETKRPYIKKIPILSPESEGEERVQRDYLKKDVPKEEKIIDLAQARERKTHIKSLIFIRPI